MMGKFKKGLSDKVRSKLKNKGKTPQVNPFEIKVNKVKHSVVNKKVEKWEKGLPGVSRSKAVKKRKDTILNELRQMKKSNSLHDKRIGEKDSNLTPEEKMVQRFALERKMQTGKQSAFNLNEDEVVLTHYGQSLAENLKDKPDSDTDDDFDAYAHRENTGKFQFGGFSAEGDESTWKDKMNEVIADSKKQKYERQMEKEKSFEATKELDSLWKSVITKMKPVRQSKETPNRRMSQFMLLSRSLVMEQKSEGAADKSKTEEQKAREEAEKLKKLEAKRLDRMKGAEIKIVSDHVSADSLSNGYSVNKKGKMQVSFATSDESDNESEEKNEDDNESEEEDKSDDDEEQDSGEDSGSDEDSYSDLDEDDDEEEDDDNQEDSEEESNNEISKEKKTSKDNPTSILKKTKTVAVISDEKNIKTNLPYVFEAPETYEQLQILLRGYNTSDQITTISRLRKCYHPSLAEDNKGKLEKIHLFLLQYFGEVVKQKECDTKLVDALASHIWEMTQTFPSVTAKVMQGIVIDRQKEYTASVERRGGRGLFPSLDTLVHLRLIEILFPTSDFRHEVTTPSMHFIAQMLAESSIRSLKDVTCGLYLCALCLQFVHLSKRYVPEVITFLHGVLHLASCASNSENSNTFPPFKKTNKELCQLGLKEKCDQVSPQISLSQILNSDPTESETNQLRCDLISFCLDLLLESVNVWNELPCLSLVMKPIDEQLKFLLNPSHPSVVKDKVERLTAQIENSRKIKFSALQHESKKPEPLKLFEPRIQEDWSGKHKKGGPNRDANNRQRMLHKYKREMKSAVREIKRDNAVLAKHKLETAIQKDAERKRKVKEIMGSLANQEGDYRAIKRGK